MVLMAVIDYDYLGKLDKVLYFLSLVLLLLVVFIGREAMGAQRWLQIGPITFQPSEFAKFVIIITLSKLLAKQTKITWPVIINAMIHVGVPLVLILIQPDLGTALVFLAIFFVLLYLAGAKPYILAGLAGLGMAILPFILKEYQKQRFLVFLNPEKDPHGSGWNIIQSKIAVGSGGLFGKGLFSGTQVQLNFVPEHSTDFIFTVMGEELGFIGCVIFLLLVGFLFWRIINVIYSVDDKFGKYMATGILIVLSFHIFINVGMTMGIMPVTGIPLPFISSGGSSLIMNMMAIGLILNIYSRRKFIY